MKVLGSKRGTKAMLWRQRPLRQLWPWSAFARSDNGTALAARFSDHRVDSARASEPGDKDSNDEFWRFSVLSFREPIHPIVSMGSAPCGSIQTPVVARLDLE